LYQWTKAELKEGLIQLSFNLTTEPIQGTYAVVAQKAFGKTIHHPFSVEEYGNCCSSFSFLAAIPVGA